MTVTITVTVIICLVTSLYIPPFFQYKQNKSLVRSPCVGYEKNRFVTFRFWYDVITHFRISHCLRVFLTHHVSFSPGTGTGTTHHTTRPVPLACVAFVTCCRCLSVCVCVCVRLLVCSITARSDSLRIFVVVDELSIHRRLKPPSCFVLLRSRHHPTPYHCCPYYYLGPLVP